MTTILVKAHELLGTSAGLLLTMAFIPATAYVGGWLQLQTVVLLAAW